MAASGCRQTWGGLDLAARGSAMSVEFYAANAPGGVAAVDLVPHTRVRFGIPAANARGGGGDRRRCAGPRRRAGTVAPAGHTNRLGDGEGENSSVGDDGDGVLHEIGHPASLRPPGSPG